MDGLDKFVSELERKTKATSGNVSLPNLLNPAFMQANTPFSSIEQMIDATNLPKATLSDELRLPGSEAINRFVCEHTHFVSWGEMVKTAGRDYMVERLRF